jgi:hypothetical protein
MGARVLTAVDGSAWGWRRKCAAYSPHAECHDRRHGISKALIRSLERRQCGRIARRHCIQLDLCPLRLDFAFELRLIINPIGPR